MMMLTVADLDRLSPSSRTLTEFYGNFYAVSFLLRKVKKKTSCLSASLYGLYV